MAKPTGTSTKGEIIEYLKAKGIPHDSSATKQELLKLVV